MSKTYRNAPAVWPQVAAIFWAQFRTTRNHLPRTNAGNILAGLLSALWYGSFAGLATALAIALPNLPATQIANWLPAALLAVFFFWQMVPLLTLSSGWSLQLKKLQIFPIGNDTLFGIEAVLRLTSAPEMLLILIGGAIGLAGNPDVSSFSPWLLLLYVPFNLMLSLGIRDWMMHSFSRNPFREALALLVVTLTIVPQALVRNGRAEKVLTYALATANGRLTPWHAMAMLSMHSFAPTPFLVLFGWLGIAFLFGRSQYYKTLAQEETFSAPQRRGAKESRIAIAIGAAIERLFGGLIGIMVRKELRSLVRMPRFRVIFGLGMLLGLVLCFTGVGTESQVVPTFFRRNILSLIVFYGMLLSGEVLIWNVFGFDGQSAQLYFVAPVPFATVLRAKNVTACLFLSAQASITCLLALVLRVTTDPLAVVNAALAVLAMGLFFLTVGNLSSVMNPRPIDPKQTLRKQAGLKMQLWVLLCMLGVTVLIGFALLAQWAAQTNWAYVGVLALELAIGFICYRLALESAVERGMQRQEEITQALTKSASPVGL